MNVPVIVNAKAVGSLGDFAAMPQEASNPIARTRSADIAGTEGASVGVWECEPGMFRRQIKGKEFCHFTQGHCFFIPDGQPAIEIHAGDSVYLPANCNGVWDVREALKKTYIIID